MTARLVVSLDCGCEPILVKCDVKGCEPGFAIGIRNDRRNAIILENPCAHLDAKMKLEILRQTDEGRPN